MKEDKSIAKHQNFSAPKSQNIYHFLNSTFMSVIIKIINYRAGLLNRKTINPVLL